MCLTGFFLWSQSTSSEKDINYYCYEGISNLDYAELHTAYTDQGEMKSVVTFLGEEKHGISEYYFPNGNLSVCTCFQSGVLNGRFERFYANGDLMLEGFYLNGEKIGLWTWYNEDSTVREKVTYSPDNKAEAKL